LRALLLGCALIALQAGPAMALAESTQMDTSQDGDPSIRVVSWRPGRLIRVRLAKGQPTIIEIPRGMAFDSMSIPEQAFIRDTQEYAEGDDDKSKSNEDKELAKLGCSRTMNMMVCVKRKRFISITPLSILDKQSLPIIAVEEAKGKNKEEIENVIIFQISTTLEQEEPYYGVKVVVAGDAPKPAIATAPVASSAPVAAAPRPVVRRRIERVAEPPPLPIINNNYVVQGDRNLLGKLGNE
jgi:hypothetical protein